MSRDKLTQEDVPYLIAQQTEVIERIVIAVDDVANAIKESKESDGSLRGAMSKLEASMGNETRDSQPMRPVPPKNIVFREFPDFSLRSLVGTILFTTLVLFGLLFVLLGTGAGGFGG